MPHPVMPFFGFGCAAILVEFALQIILELRHVAAWMHRLVQQTSNPVPSLASCVLQDSCWYASRRGSLAFSWSTAIGAGALPVQSAGSPSLVKDLPAGLSQFRAPLSETGLLQLHKVTMVWIVRISKAPWKLSADWALVWWK